MTLHIPLGNLVKTERRYQNWKILDSQAFQASLASHLHPLPVIRVEGTLTQSDLDAQARHITAALPPMPPTPHAPQPPYCHSSGWTATSPASKRSKLSSSSRAPVPPPSTATFPTSARPRTAPAYPIPSIYRNWRQ
ncbi:hypothetical protein CROQUDRAFT_102684 [Cronartium quercuum f. sp. fusiforme G11]|uniref:Uncharacterized protein n=1 Tax=Cronartium quercuum f. sp. fusiforme G11 TaxID=708437 RepID=A0A9P6N4P0_9BASI|nr:hypothetical protein CROQUDRAFT_102684 [Cronartium quercuum f. sp. fusiforme G11]